MFILQFAICHLPFRIVSALRDPPEISTSPPPGRASPQDDAVRIALCPPTDWCPPTDCGSIMLVFRLDQRCGLPAVDDVKNPPPQDLSQDPLPSHSC